MMVTKKKGTVVTGRKYGWQGVVQRRLKRQIWVLWDNGVLTKEDHTNVRLTTRYVWSA